MRHSGLGYGNPHLAVDAVTISNRPSGGLLREEIQHVPQRGGLGAVDLGKSAAIAGHRGEAFVLHIEDLGEHPAGGAELVGFEGGVAAFGALPVFVLHWGGPGANCLVLV